MKIVLFFLSVALAWGTVESFGAVVQYFSAILLFISVFVWALHNKITIDFSYFDPLSLVLCFAVPLLSTIVVLLNGNLISVAYSAALMCICICIVYCLKRYDLFQFSRIYLSAVTCLIFCVFLFEFDNLTMALSAVETEHGLFRFTPFDNHPNLTGHFFGVGLVLSSGFLMQKNNRNATLWYLFCAVFSGMFVLAASSRGALVSCLVAIGLQVWVRLYTTDKKYAVNGINRVLYIFVIVASVVAVVGIFFDYIYRMLDMGSDHRGLGSGGTGRLDNWSDFFDLMIDNFEVAVFGHGLRTWSVDLIGFDSDNSYINMFYESGFLMTILVVYLMVRKAMVYKNIAHINFNYAVVYGLFAFYIIESVFARYLITIGNPASFLAMAVYMYKVNYTESAS